MPDELIDQKYLHQRGLAHHHQGLGLLDDDTQMLRCSDAQMMFKMIEMILYSGQHVQAQSVNGPNRSRSGRSVINCNL
uniref:HDC05062 n=1 Tax=Drosophila melanogaster TaxID=7227 RepID=Q6IGV5_DROME|nr:TPA_inf: HDC05062 [Drosophila melanogaster]